MVSACKTIFVAKRTRRPRIYVNYPGYQSTNVSQPYGGSRIFEVLQSFVFSTNKGLLDLFRWFVSIVETLIVEFLLQLFSNQQFAKNVSENNLQQLLTQLIGLLVEKRLERLQPAESLNLFQKFVNNLVLKILERSEHTAVIW